MKRNDDCGFTGAVVLPRGSQPTRAASERGGLDEGVNGGEMEDDEDDEDENDENDEESLDLEYDGFDNFNILDAKAQYAGVSTLWSLKAR
ncbi:hypothetical protein PoHVEF18_002987 [Penicillium ochrochloron]